MAGDFPNLDIDTLAQWPESNQAALVTRPWFPAYSITLTVVATVIFISRIWAQARKNNDGLGIDDLIICSAWVSIISIVKRQSAHKTLGICHSIYRIVLGGNVGL